MQRFKTVISFMLIFMLIFLSACSSKSEKTSEQAKPEENTGAINQDVSTEVTYDRGAEESKTIAKKEAFTNAIATDEMQIGNRPNFNTEDYDYIEENRFLDTKTSPLSTFSIDVDTASYSNIRRFILSGETPPRDAVRIEEMINYFTYDYPEPKDEKPFSMTTEINTCPWNENHFLTMIGLQGKKIDRENTPPSNLVFLFDVSGSMNEPNKLPLLKSAFKLLVNELDEKDRVAIVVYAGAAGVVLDSTSANQKDEILEALSDLRAGGSTAGGEGIQLAYSIAKKNFIEGGNNRVILATDGDFNVGISSDGKLTRLIEKKREDGVFLSVLGFGTGNYKDSKMERLADKGNGNYAYIDNLMEARKVLVNEIGSTLFTIAKDVKLQVEFNPGKVKGYRLLGYENRLMKNEDFNDDKKDAGELGAGHTVTAFYELIPADSNEEIIGSDDLKYQDVSIKNSDEILNIKLRYKKPDENTSKLIEKGLEDEDIIKTPSNNFIFASSVAEFGMLLRNSGHMGTSSYESVIEMAKQSRGDDEEGYRSEFIRLVEIAKSLVK